MVYSQAVSLMTLPTAQKLCDEW